MNYKLLLPNYRQRYVTVLNELKKTKFDKFLNLGCGEGDYDSNIQKNCKNFFGCDINVQDVKNAKKLNPKGIYLVQDAQKLNYKSAHFDGLMCLEVLEHVPNYKKAISEISRVSKKGAKIVISVPNYNFPITYDPINFFLQKKDKFLPIGTYAFGHDKLMQEKDLEKLFKKHNLKIKKKILFSKYLVGLLEMYWPGLVQKMLKRNSSNQNKKKGKGLKITTKEPKLAKIADIINYIDSKLFSKSKKAYSLMYVLEKSK